VDRRMTEGRDERAKGTPNVTIDDPDDVIGGVAGGGSGERATGTPNTVYNLSSVLFHALQGGASYDTYVEDAEQEGDEELTEFFRSVREEDRDRAAEARMLLVERTPTATRAEGATAGAAAGTEQVGSSEAGGDVMPGSTGEATSPRPEPTDDFPGTEPVEGEDPTARSGEVPPPPEEVPSERAGEFPMAEEVPPPSAAEVPVAEEGPSRTPPPRTQGASLDPLLSQEDMVRGQAKRDRGEEDKGLTDDVRDAIFDEGGRGREGTGGEDQR
jgi:hypothetical protein